MKIILIAFISLASMAASAEVVYFPAQKVCLNTTTHQLLSSQDCAATGATSYNYDVQTPPTRCYGTFFSHDQKVECDGANCAGYSLVTAAGFPQDCI